MEFKIFNSFDNLASRLDDWNQILKESASHVPFLTYEYQSTWWETRGGGEWPEDSQLVLAAAFEGENLVGVAPLFFTENILGKPALMLVGSIEVSDFLDFIVRPEDLPAFTEGLLDILSSDPEVPEWAVLDLYNLLEESPTLAALEVAAGQLGWAYKKVHLQPSPYIELPGDFETYLAEIDKKQRHEIRRKLRNVEQSLEVGGFYIVDDAAQVEADTAAIIKMMAQDPTKKDFLTAEMRTHLHKTARMAFEAGWLHLAFFTLDGHKAAGNFSFNFDGRLWLYNSGWEWDYRDFSPGWVLVAYLIEWANQNDIREFDFMRGNEAYKYKFGAVDRHIYRIVVERG